MENETIIPAHQWVDENGEVLILRFANRDGTSRGGFQHPMKVGEAVTAPDWDPHGDCGGGIHGWPLGLSMGSGKDLDWSALWQVYGVLPADIVGNIEGEGKCKFRTGTLRYLGDWQTATNFVLASQIKWVHHASSGAASSTGERGAASSTGHSGAASSTGYSGAASSTGYSGAASSTGHSGAASSTGKSGAASSTGHSGAASSTGYSGAASSTGKSGAASSTGYSGAASSTGDRGAASSTGHSGAASSTGESGAASSTGHRGAASSTGYSGAASSTGYSGAASSTGHSGAAIATGPGSKARGGLFGAIALAWWNSEKGRPEMRCALTGNDLPGSLKANVWYRLDAAGEFVEAEE